MKWNYKFKGYRISQWLKILAINYRNNRYMAYVPLKVIVYEVIPKYPPFEKFVRENLIETFINEGWTEQEKKNLIYFLRQFIKKNFNVEV
jgi:hypothetical protein